MEVFASSVYPLFESLQFSKFLEGLLKDKECFKLCMELKQLRILSKFSSNLLEYMDFQVMEYCRTNYAMKFEREFMLEFVYWFENDFFQSFQHLLDGKFLIDR